MRLLHVFACCTVLRGVLCSVECYAWDSVNPSRHTDCNELNIFGAKYADIDLSNIVFDNLQRMDLTRCNLTKCPLLHSSTKETLTQLWLTMNRINNISQNYFYGFKILDDLEINENFLTKMPNLPKSVKETLKRFMIDDNKITHVPWEYFSGFKVLEKIRMQNNRITEIPHGKKYGLLPKLQWINFDRLWCDCHTLTFLTNLPTNISLIAYIGDNRTSVPCEGKYGRKELTVLRNIPRPKCPSPPSPPPPTTPPPTAPPPTTPSPTAPSSTAPSSTAPSSTTLSSMDCRAVDRGGCLNGGKCVATEVQNPTLHRCKCPKAWTGNFCEIDIDECTDVSSGVRLHECNVNSICQNLNGSYSCKCDRGWTGKFCNSQIL